jgi:uncharacterized protein (DUF433 family)
LPGKFWGSIRERGANFLEFPAAHRTLFRMSKIIIDPDICNGVPTIQGTRITAQTVLEFLSAGDSIDEVLEEYPSLSREDVLGCLAYSARLMGHHFSVQAVA